MMGSARNWPQQNAVYPYVIPEQGRSSYGNNMGSMGTMAPSYPTASTAPLAGPSNTHMIKSPYVTPYPDPWNNMYDTVAPMSAEQPGWERSNMGFGGYQQHSPSRSDGSASTQVSSLSSPYTHPSPLIKLENQPDLSPYGSRFAFENAALQQPISMSTTTAPIMSPQSHRPFTTSLVSYGHQTEDVKYDFDSYDLESLSISGDPRMLKSEGQAKRGYTTPEEARCSCDICGQSFKRSNNLKTHMQTHAAHRSQPHKCEYEDCSRAFGRKTDLVRHEQSVSLIRNEAVDDLSLIILQVHLKERNFLCHQCGHSFARKDTLRRYATCSLHNYLCKQDSDIDTDTSTTGVQNDRP